MQVEKRSCVSSKKRGIHGLSKIDNKRSKAYQKGQKHQINKNSTVSKQNRRINV